MRNLKLTLEYDGAPYYGFQRQPRHPTVQSHLETALSDLFNQKIKIKAASGRTDRGVHAVGQVINFEVDSKLKLDSIQKGLNRYLPGKIVVRDVKEASEEFHARFDAKSKTYEYLVWNDPVRSPLYADYTYHVPYKLDLKKMREAAKILKGKHDFKAFCAVDPAKKNRENTVRTIKRFVVSREDSLVSFKIEADGFLYNMVRILVGTLLEVGQNRLTLTALKQVLKARDRKRAGKTVPPHGLTLVNVKY